jgi:hypothetical protein
MLPASGGGGIRLISEILGIWDLVATKLIPLLLSLIFNRIRCYGVDSPTSSWIVNRC